VAALASKGGKKNKSGGPESKQNACSCWDQSSTREQMSGLLQGVAPAVQHRSVQAGMKTHSQQPPLSLQAARRARRPRRTRRCRPRRQQRRPACGSWRSMTGSGRKCWRPGRPRRSGRCSRTRRPQLGGPEQALVCTSMQACPGS
jgi:hypothetical protein